LLWRQRNLASHSLSTCKHPCYHNRNMLADRVGPKTGVAKIKIGNILYYFILRNMLYVWFKYGKPN
jgi:hypothetical protein